VCAVSSSRLVGVFYSNLLSTCCLLPGCRFGGLFNFVDSKFIVSV
jgi:hypothetical protein